MDFHGFKWTIWWPHVLGDEAALGTLGTLRPVALHLQGIAAKLPAQARRQTGISALHYWRRVTFTRHRLKHIDRSHPLHFPSIWTSLFWSMSQFAFLCMRFFFNLSPPAVTIFCLEAASRIVCIPILLSPAFSGSTVEACDVPAAFVETWNKCQHISIIFHHPSNSSPLYRCLVEPDNAWLLQTGRMPQLQLSFANSPCQLCDLHKTSCSPCIIKTSNLLHMFVSQLFVSNLPQALAFLWRARLSELEAPPPLQSKTYQDRHATYSYPYTDNT